MIAALSLFPFIIPSTVRSPVPVPAALPDYRHGFGQVLGFGERESIQMNPMGLIQSNHVEGQSAGARLEVSMNAGKRREREKMNSEKITETATR